ncbi:MAG: hypothetical protein QM398_06125 [Thermoproteota archaeon]|nr:hypothetical protein [Thermoproteota archaeon]
MSEQKADFNENGKPCPRCRHREEMILENTIGAPAHICLNCMTQKDE